VEVQLALSRLPLEVVALDDYPLLGGIPEPGYTLVENAFKKAEPVFLEPGIPALADAPGLAIAVEGALLACIRRAMPGKGNIRGKL
jgi:Xanthosine triphosphate pyrophosphatase